MSARSASSAELDRMFAALADPTRRAILARLATGEATVSELAQPFSMSLPAISKHLGVLERAGLVLRRQAAQWRPRTIDAARLRAVAEWLEPYRALWDRRYDRLDAYLHTLQVSEKKHGRKGKN